MSTIYVKNVDPELREKLEAVAAVKKWTIKTCVEVALSEWFERECVGESSSGS